MSIGINNSIANTFLPEILQVFQGQFPDVEIKVQEVTLQQEVQMLKNHELDVIFQRFPSFEQNAPQPALKLHQPESSPPYPAIAVAHHHNEST